MNNPWTRTDEDEKRRQDINSQLRYCETHPIPNLEKDANWLASKLYAALREVDKLRDERDAASALISLSTDQVVRRTKEAVKDAILENCESPREWGPHDQHIDYYAERDIMDAIDEAEVDDEY